MLIFISLAFFLAIIAVLTYIILLKNKNAKKVRMLLYYDELIAHWNFNKFRLEASNVLLHRHKRQLALLYLDIDNFKYVNDIYGYTQGDNILKQLAGILKNFISPSDMFGRISADKFVLLLEYPSEDELQKRVQNLKELLTVLSKNFHDNYRMIICGGIYKIPSDEISISTAIDRANYARKSAKNSLQNNFLFYSEKLREDIVAEKHLEQIMETALHRGEFVPFFQPKYDIFDKKIIGSEALVRWNRPGKGWLSPDQFLPTFEKNGFIVQIDFCVFETVCKRIREWLNEGKRIVPISCNFSRLHLGNQNFAEQLKEIADRYDVPPKYLELEITETVAADNADLFIPHVHKLKQLGFSLSIDDFGSGYSSLGLLQHLAVDILKLDRSFLQKGYLENKEQVIIEGIVMIAHKLNMRVICEGVETEHHVSLLKEIGCHYAQGFLYSKPLPSETFAAMLDRK